MSLAHVYFMINIELRVGLLFASMEIFSDKFRNLTMAEKFSSSTDLPEIEV